MRIMRVKRTVHPTDSTRPRTPRYSLSLSLSCSAFPPNPPLPNFMAQVKSTKCVDRPMYGTSVYYCSWPGISLSFCDARIAAHPAPLKVDFHPPINRLAILATVDFVFRNIKKSDSIFESHAQPSTWGTVCTKSHVWWRRPSSISCYSCAIINDANRH
jgi:hypothetical protein